MTVKEQERLLGEMIAECERRGLRSTRGAYFRKKNGEHCKAKDAAFCCAQGALDLINVQYSRDLAQIIEGNDTEVRWTPSDDDSGESLGHAFYQAMRK